jgi:hypothetical protein
MFSFSFQLFKGKIETPATGLAWHCCFSPHSFAPYPFGQFAICMYFDTFHAQ